MIPVVKTRNERAVDLEHVDREALEVRQRGVAGAEIVHGELDAEVLQRGELENGRLRFLHDDALGDLELQMLWVKPRCTDGLLDVVEQARVLELYGG